MPARKSRTILPLDALRMPLPPVPPARKAQGVIPLLSPLLEPLLHVGKERLVLMVQQDDRPTFMSALIEPDS